MLDMFYLYDIIIIVLCVFIKYVNQKEMLYVK